MTMVADRAGNTLLDSQVKLKEYATISGYLTPLGYQRITTLSSAQTLTIPAGATIALVQCEAQNVRWRDDGTAPTASVGMLMFTTSPLYYVFTGNLAALQFIEAAPSAGLNVTYYK